MISFFTFIGITLGLTFEGALLARTILKTKQWLLPITLGLPIAALINVLIVLTLTTSHVALTPMSLGVAHLIFLIGEIVSGKWLVDRKEISNVTNHYPLTTRSWFFIIPSAFILFSSFAYSFSHAVLLPTFQYDSATNWTMRSQISFYDETIAFDTTEVRGMAKPQYPFLFHALQITANQGQLARDASRGQWSDSSANAILFILSLSTFGALYLMLRSKMSLEVTIATLGALCSIPLFSIHLGQGYADLNLAQYFLLSLLCLLLWQDEKSKAWLALSAVFIAASVWTKSEGTFFGLLPWLFVLAIYAWRQTLKRKEILQISTLAIALSIPWHLFAFSKGFLLTPHGSDFEIAFHAEGLREAMLGLFSRGSFGIIWYGVVPILALTAYEAFRKKRTNALLILAWPTIVFLEVLFVYLMTPNVRFLLNAESYYRQMMIPAAMFVLAFAWWWQTSSTKTYADSAVCEPPLQQ